MKTNKLKLGTFALIALMGTQTLSQTSFAQTKAPAASEGSGASNGSDNRDALSYSQTLTPEKMSEQNIDQAIKALLDAIRKIKETEIPDYAGAGNDFWHGLSPHAIVLVKEANSNLLSKINISIKKLGDISKVVNPELGVIQAFEREEAEYIAANQHKLWKHKRAALYSGLANSVKSLFKTALDNLLPPYASLGNTVFYGQYDFYEFSLPYNQCDSVTCVSLLDDLSNKYISFLKKLKHQEIEIPNVISSQSVNRFYGEGCGNIFPDLTFTCEFSELMRALEENFKKQNNGIIADINVRQIRKNAH